VRHSQRKTRRRKKDSRPSGGLIFSPHTGIIYGITGRAVRERDPENIRPAKKGRMKFRAPGDKTPYRTIRTPIVGGQEKTVLRKRLILRTKKGKPRSKGSFILPHRQPRVSSGQNRMNRPAKNTRRREFGTRGKEKRETPSLISQKSPGWPFTRKLTCRWGGEETTRDQILKKLMQVVLDCFEGFTGKA